MSSSPCRYNRSKSGWFDSVCFADWFKTVVVPYFKNKTGKKIMIGDNLSSHFSHEVLELCKKHKIVFMCLPPNATHLMQPLDVAFFAPLKKYWREILKQWKKKEGRYIPAMTKEWFPKLLSRLYARLEINNCGSENLIAGEYLPLVSVGYFIM